MHISFLKNASPFIRIFIYKFYIFTTELIYLKTPKETSKTLFSEILQSIGLKWHMIKSP